MKNSKWRVTTLNGLINILLVALYKLINMKTGHLARYYGVYFKRYFAHIFRADNRILNSVNYIRWNIHFSCFRINYGIDQWQQQILIYLPTWEMCSLQYCEQRFFFFSFLCLLKVSHIQHGINEQLLLASQLCNG